MATRIKTNKINPTTGKRIGAVLLAASLIGVACGSPTEDTTDAAGASDVVTVMMDTDVVNPTSGQASEADQTSMPNETDRPAREVTDDEVTDMTDSQVISSWGQVPDGVVFIETEGAGFYDVTGTFVPEGIPTIELPGQTFGFLPDAAPTGTGFFVSADGLIVTNNHVVTGAASVQVHVPGEDRPRNARVLGASECWDLAVLELVDEGSYPHFAWAAEEPAVATEVYAVGYPLSDPEITVTKGVVSKASVDAQTIWASVDDALETDADINPGNSGGPLVTEDGVVVGINFAGNGQTRQGFSIKAAAAMRVIDQLKDGNDVDYLGMNVEAVHIGGGDFGVLVRSVETGSDAFDAGVQPGDFIVHVEGTSVAQDGTMAEYCDILRTKGADGELTLGLFNYFTGEFRDVLVTRDQ